MTARNRGSRRRRAREKPARATARPAEDDRLRICHRCGRELAPSRKAWWSDAEGRWCQCVNPVPGFDGDPSPPFREREYGAAVSTVAWGLGRGR